MKLLHAVVRKGNAAAALTVVAASFYLVSRTVLLSMSDSPAADKVFGVLLLLAEGFIVLHAIGFALNVFRIQSFGESASGNEPELKTFPPVAVLVAARHEPLKVLEETFATLSNLNYPNKKIYLLDDSSEQRYKDEADFLGKKYNITVFRRAERHGAKAGVINDVVAGLDAKYIAIFDADQNPLPNFLEKTVAFLEADDRLAFVQSPQFYTNITTGPVPEGAAMQQAIFYENICEGKNVNNAMFCCGTNVVFRLDALKKVGGFDENSITEDFATSLKFHMMGYRSLYYNRACAFGMAPESLPEYFKQQARWAGGTAGMLRRFVVLFPGNFHRMTVGQWWEYFLSGSYYFIGWAYLVLMLCPVFYLLFNVPSFFINARVYFGTFVPYFGLSLLIFFSTMRQRGYIFRQVYRGIVLGFLTFPVLMKAVVLGLFGKKMTFEVTQKGKGGVLPLARLWPYLALLLLNFAAIANGMRRWHENPSAIGVNMFWAAFHSAILLNVFYFNREPDLPA